VVPAMGAPTAVGVDPRRSNPAHKPVESVTQMQPERMPEKTDPPSSSFSVPDSFLIPKDEDDDDMDEKTEALLEVPGRRNPFEQQPRTIAAPDLPAAAQVNPYAGMPGTVAANDLPAAAFTNAGQTSSTKSDSGPSTVPMPPQPIPAGKRPTGTGLPQQGPGIAAPMGIRPTADAASRVGPSMRDDALDDETGIAPPPVMHTDTDKAPLGAAPVDGTSEQKALELGDPDAIENPTRVQPIKPPVHWKSVLFAEDDDEASITLPVPERNKLLRKKGVWRGPAPFWVAGMLGTLSIALAWVITTSAERRATRMWNLVPVSVASTDLSEGTVMTMEMISTRAIPEQFVTASVVKPDGYGYVVGQKLLVPVQGGDPLLWSHFELAQATERLSRRVNMKARAMSVVTPYSTSVGGWVRPGDWVDLIVTLRDKKEGGTAKAAVTLVQDVPVLATGKITEKTNYGILNNAQREYQHVSLLLLPEEAEMVTLAYELGSIRLTLRNEQDHDVNRDGYGSSSKTLLDGARVKLLQMRRLATIQSIRDAAPSAPVAPMKLRIEPVR
jgi:pilus assembly protein CpaB